MKDWMSRNRWDLVYWIDWRCFDWHSIGWTDCFGSDSRSLTIPRNCSTRWIHCWTNQMTRTRCC